MKTTMKALMWVLIISGILLGQFINASQNDYSIANDTGANVRADINSALQASQSQNSGTTAPSTMYAFQLWMDTSGGTPILKLRNAANSAWINIGDGSLTGLGLLDRTGGTVSGELILSATNDVKIPVGTTAQRNGSPVNGQLRYNSDLKNYEGYHESQFSQFQREVANADYISNVSLTASVGSNALTIALKTAAGANAAAGDPAIIGFRSATLASGDVSLVKVTGALSTVISSGSTAGHTSAVAAPIYVYLLNNAGTAELAWSTILFDEGVLVSTTAEGGAGAADTASTMYSTTARSSVAFRLVGKLISTQTTAGTWAAIPTNIQTGSVGKLSTVTSISARYSLSGTQTLTDATSTAIIWNSIGSGGFDNPGGMDTSTGKFYARAAGKYVFSTSIGTASSYAMVAGNRVALSYKVNGGTAKQLNFIIVSGSVTESPQITGGDIVDLNAGDYLEIFGYFDLNGASYGVASSNGGVTFFTIHRIGY